MQAEIEHTSAIYTADTGDWRITVDTAAGIYEIIPTLTGGLSYSSGANLDNLATLIQAAKAHAVANGIAWSN